MFLRTDTIEEMHVEITNKCNASCPMCNRNIFGSVDRPGRGLNEWTLEDIDKVFSDELPNLKRVYFCGTHGDPIASKYLFEAIDKVKRRNINIEIFTNGSLKPDSWWEKLVKILDSNDRITFGVDGIETNHLYRQNTHIDKILSHMKISCNSLVKVRWDFLAFKHNEYEIEKCKSLAAEFGVTDFRIRRTPRFDNFDPFPVMNSKKEITHYLEPPIKEELKHPSHITMKSITQFKNNRSQEEIFESLNKQISVNEFSIVDYTPPEKLLKWKVACIYQEAKKIYVNSRLEVFPCCYISDDNESFRKFSDTELKYPQNELSLHNKSWKDILQHKFFTEELEKSWNNDNIIPRCIKTCGIVKREQEQNMKVKI
jgi:MoaA/NifB/PqqE/SkfB family radical SAM enzyme